MEPNQANSSESNDEPTPASPIDPPAPPAFDMEPVDDVTAPRPPSPPFSPPPLQPPSTLQPPSPPRSARPARPVRARRRWIDDDPSSRELVLGWCLWLLGSWCASWVFTRTQLPGRWMVFASLIGIMVVWPAFRLSQERLTRRLRRGGDRSAATKPDAGGQLPLRRSAITPALVLRDWVSMILLFQAAIWPLWFTAGWRLEQTMWVNAAVASWSLLTAALVAWGCQSGRSLHRTLTMLAVVALLLAEPLVQAIVHAGAERGYWSATGWTMRVSPIETTHALTIRHELFEAQPWAGRVITVAAAAVVAWLLVLLLRRRPGAARAAEPAVAPTADA